MVIRKRRSVEDVLYKHSVNEMATMGTTRGGITIKVFSGVQYHIYTLSLMKLIRDA